MPWGPGGLNTRPARRPGRHDVAEPLGRVLRLTHARRTPRDRTVRKPARSPSPCRRLARRVQHLPSPQRAWHAHPNRVRYPVADRTPTNTLITGGPQPGSGQSAKCSPTMARPTSHVRGRRGARRITSSISALGPTDRAPTVRQNGSSKPCCANGHTPSATAPQTTEPVHSPHGSTTTTTNDPTALGHKTPASRLTAA